MPNHTDTKSYQIRLKGHLDPEWAGWFDDLMITLERDGNTLLTGPVADQAALHGLFKKVRDVGLTLLSVNPVCEIQTVESKEEPLSKKEKTMNATRKIAIAVGILYIIGTVAGILSVVFTGPVRDAQDPLLSVSANQNQIILGALFILLMGFALALIPVLVFPILKKYNEALALGYVIFRGALEAVTDIAVAGSLLLLVPLSRAYIEAGTPQASWFQTFDTLLQGVADLPLTVFAFGLGGLIFYYLLYRSKLIPRWLSIWGLAAILSHLATGLLILFGLQNSFSTSNTIMNLPIFLQEMVMAVWLIVKGFNPAAVISSSSNGGDIQ